MEHLDRLSGAITYPMGFFAAGVRAGIKEKGEDIALIFSERPAAAAGIFTQYHQGCTRVDQSFTPSQSDSKGDRCKQR